jgi:hypothetical protein
MTSNHDSPRPRRLSRREFLTAAAAAGLLAACGPAQPAPAPTSAPPPPPAATSAPPPPTATNAPPPPAATSTPAPVPTVTPAPAAASSVPRPGVIKFYPDVTSKVVRARHSGVWSGETLEPKAIRQMLDASITKLTDLNDAKEAWLALFKPTEKIAIKVNAFRNSVIFTHVPLVTAVTDSLVEAGIPAEQIVVFDFWTSELETAGFTINQDGRGVRCYGTEDYTKGFKVNQVNTQLSNILLNSDALINIPVLKSHMISGISFAMKNHYGTVQNPESLHSVGACIPGLNALPEIKDRTRLIIGDVLQASIKYGYSWPYWKADYTGDSILMSFDPVAHDTVGFQILTQLLTDQGGDPAAYNFMAKPYLEGAAKAGLGAYDPANFELTEVKVG